MASGLDEIRARAERLRAVATHYTTAWQRVVRIADEVMRGIYRGDKFHNITPDTVMYLNPTIAKAAWATPDKLVCQISHHWFYRA